MFFQTRSLLRLFEEDVESLRNYTNSLRSALIRLMSAQSEMSASIMNLSSVLAAYKDQVILLIFRYYVWVQGT